MRGILTLLIATGALLAPPGAAAAPATPIKHLIVIYDENVSFDHYFGTYPYALNPDGEPAFTPKVGTPAVNGLTDALRTSNPNATNPFRLARTQAVTCDNNHSYTAEQSAFNGGLMDKFVQFTSCPGNTTMGYYDGNTVTALWNYAQNYALSDSYFGSTFGPSLPGHINLISGNTHGATPDLAGQVVGGTVIGGPHALGDECGNRNPAADISFGAAPNIGTLLSARGVTWGYFMGGFRPTATDAGGAVCGAMHANVSGANVRDYIAHHQPFQYYDATRNPTHAAPAAATDIGHDDPAGPGPRVNHQYDLADFATALQTGNVPEVSFLKPPGYADGHAGYSSPLDEQRFLVETVNAIQASAIWPDTAIVIAYDDSDGWYDHVASPITNSSHVPGIDTLNGDGVCEGPGGPGTPTAMGYGLRCGSGPRLPLLVISPYARVNHVDHTTIDQASILRFIEDNWGTGQLGDGSFDDIPSPKPTLLGLLDFSAGAARAGMLTLDPATGNPPVLPGAGPPPGAVAKKARRLTLTSKRRRDRRRPFVFVLRGKLTPPAGVSRAQACRGRVSVRVVAARKVVTTRRARLKPNCRWSLRLTFRNARRLVRGRLTLRATFLGNADVASIRARGLRVRAG